ncbi:MAG TPA: carbon-nitrogen hydrolase family protein [Gemmataceae bacterium]|jgi:N-carbamoylputrescine amidase|nr:carbon-nitrogen hydrolase family protein [Gemmataceae bacterium]
MTLPIACGQMACTTFDRPSNLDKADQLIHEAVRLGAKLILLPELLTTGYTYDRRLHDFAEPIGGSTTRWLQRRSRQTGRWIGAGMVEDGDQRTFDTFLLSGPAGEFHVYRKQYPAFFEKLYFHRGRTANIFDTPLGRIGVMICWDMVHTRLYREMAGRIDLLLVCSAWPDLNQGNIPLYGVRDWLSRQPLQRPQRLAAKLKVPVAYCNMTGDFTTRVPGLGLTYRSTFAGSSSISDAAGNIAMATRAEETVVVADVQVGTGPPQKNAG